jgi:hypothetical protein
MLSCCCCCCCCRQVWEEVGGEWEHSGRCSIVASPQMGRPPDVADLPFVRPLPHAAMLLKGAPAHAGSPLRPQPAATVGTDSLKQQQLAAAAAAAEPPPGFEARAPAVVAALHREVQHQQAELAPPGFAAVGVPGRWPAPAEPSGLPSQAAATPSTAAGADGLPPQVQGDRWQAGGSENGLRGICGAAADSTPPPPPPAAAAAGDTQDNGAPASVEAAMFIGKQRRCCFIYETVCALCGGMGHDAAGCSTPFCHECDRVSDEGVGRGLPLCDSKECSRRGAASLWARAARNRPPPAAPTPCPPLPPPLLVLCLVRSLATPWVSAVLPAAPAAGRTSPRSTETAASCSAASAGCGGTMARTAPTRSAAGVLLTSLTAC